MKIKEVRFEKLFSLEKYENERIGFTAEVEEGENAEKVAGELHFKIVGIEDCLNAYRTCLNGVDYASREFEGKQEQIQHLQNQISEMGVTIEELYRQAEKGNVDAKLQHACSRQSYKQLQEQLIQYKEDLEKWDNTVKKLVKAKDILQERIKNGNFSLKDWIFQNLADIIMTTRKEELKKIG